MHQAEDNLIDFSVQFVFVILVGLKVLINKYKRIFIYIENWIELIPRVLFFRKSSRAWQNLHSMQWNGFIEIRNLIWKSPILIFKILNLVWNILNLICNMLNLIWKSPNLKLKTYNIYLHLLYASCKCFFKVFNKIFIYLFIQERWIRYYFRLMNFI